MDTFYCILVCSVLLQCGTWAWYPEDVEGSDDDIIFTSGSGSGCNSEDEDDCASQLGRPGGDSLITPVVTIKSTTPPPTTTTGKPSPVPEFSGSAPCHSDDEEECDSSGAGSLNEGDEDGIDVGATDDITFNNTSNTDHNSTSSPHDHTSPLVTVVDITESTSVRQTTTATARPKPIGNPSDPGGTIGGGGLDTSVGGSNDKKHQNNMAWNIGIIVGIAGGVVLMLLILAFIIYKYRSRDEGSYKIDESKNYRYETCNTKPPPPPPVNGSHYKATTPTKTKKKDVKEWYV